MYIYIYICIERDIYREREILTAEEPRGMAEEPGETNARLEPWLRGEGRNNNNNNDNNNKNHNEMK